MSLFERSERHEGLSAWWAVREVDHLFASLGRYTRFVGFGKWALVVVAVILTASLLIWPLITKDTSGMRVSFVDSKTAKQAPSSPVMSNPEYQGSSVSGQQYKVTGKTATQKTSDLIVIEAVEAQMVKPTGGWYSLNADTAEYNQAAKRIELMNNVTVIDDKGTTFTTSRATIETDTSHIYGNEAINGVGSMGNIVASGFEIKDNGDHIIFTGGAKQLTVTVDRSAKKK
ncbi:MAG: LPS export ABC transporter periplasmic protein LptC [Rickettsiales bacterium]